MAALRPVIVTGDMYDNVYTCVICNNTQTKTIHRSSSSRHPLWSRKINSGVFTQ